MSPVLRGAPSTCASLQIAREYVGAYQGPHDCPFSVSPCQVSGWSMPISGPNPDDNIGLAVPLTFSVSLLPRSPLFLTTILGVGLARTSLHVSGPLLGAKSLFFTACLLLVGLPHCQSLMGTGAAQVKIVTVSTALAGDSIVSLAQMLLCCMPLLNFQSMELVVFEDCIHFYHYFFLVGRGAENLSSSFLHHSVNLTPTCYLCDLKSPLHPWRIRIGMITPYPRRGCGGAESRCGLLQATQPLSSGAGQDRSIRGPRTNSRI